MSCDYVSTIGTLYTYLYVHIVNIPTEWSSATRSGLSSKSSKGEKATKEFPPQVSGAKNRMNSLRVNYDMNGGNACNSRKQLLLQSVRKPEGHLSTNPLRKGKIVDKYVKSSTNKRRKRNKQTSYCLFSLQPSF